MEYKTGDLVTVRSWESMAAEYGVTEDGDIFTPGGYAFLSAKKEHCGKTYKVVAVHKRHVELEGCISPEGVPWSFTDCMLSGLDSPPVATHARQPQPVFGL